MKGRRITDDTNYKLGCQNSQAAQRPHCRDRAQGKETEDYTIRVHPVVCRATVEEKVMLVGKEPKERLSLVVLRMLVLAVVAFAPSTILAIYPIGYSEFTGMFIAVIAIFTLAVMCGVAALFGWTRYWH